MTQKRRSMRIKEYWKDNWGFNMWSFDRFNFTNYLHNIIEGVENMTKRIEK